MSDERSTPTGSDSVSRRDVIRMAGLAGVGSGLLASTESVHAGRLAASDRGFAQRDPPDEAASVVINEGFESGGFSDSFDDSSQSRASPAVTDEAARSGERALFLASSPGTSTRNSVDTAEAVSGRTSLTAFVKPTRVEGNEGGIGARVVDEATGRELDAKSSGWDGGIVVLYRDEHGETRAEDREVFGSVFPVGEWSRLRFEVTPAGLVVAANGETYTFETAEDWTAKSYRYRLYVNGWGNGEAQAAAFDDVTVETRPTEAVGDEPTESPVAVDNLRLVQTVENSRVLAGDSSRSNLARSAPVAEDLLLGRGHDDVTWSTPDPPFVAGRQMAPVMDVEVSDPAAVEEPITIRGRLVEDGRTRSERTATIAPEALAGDDSDRRFRLEELYDLDVPDRLPLLEMLAANPDLVDGEYPTFPASADVDVEVTVDGPPLAEPVTERLSLDPSDVVTTGPISIGIVPIEHDGQGEENYRFADDVDVLAEAEHLARFVLDTFPVTGVRIAALASPIEGIASGRLDSVYRCTYLAQSALDDAIGTARTFAIDAEGHRHDDVAVDGVDVTVGYVPREGFFDEDEREGTTPTMLGNALFDAVLAEVGEPHVAAHEIGHYLLGTYFDDPDLAKGGDEPQHATGRLTSTGYRHRDGDLAVLPGRASLMHDSDEVWMDAHTYRGLMDVDLRGFD